eukprot:g10799.t1
MKTPRVPPSSPPSTATTASWGATSPPCTSRGGGTPAARNTAVLTSLAPPAPVGRAGKESYGGPGGSGGDSDSGSVCSSADASGSRSGSGSGPTSRGMKRRVSANSSSGGGDSSLGDGQLSSRKWRGVPQEVVLSGVNDYIGGPIDEGDITDMDSGARWMAGLVEAGHRLLVVPTAVALLRKAGIPLTRDKYAPLWGGWPECELD